MKITVADALMKALAYEGVEVVFGIPGGVLLPIYDAIYKAKLNHIQVVHEQGGAHMADGYARATGKVGVCIGTSGPGATNLVTGIATAYMDSIPMVAITGQVATPNIGRDAFQEADITGITLPITKHNYLVKNPDDFLTVVHEAFHVARSGRPGPVLVDIPVDVSRAEIKYDYPPTLSKRLKGYHPKKKGHPKQVAQAAKALSQAERPLLYAGGGVVAVSAHQELRQLAEKLGAPCGTTIMGKGAFPENHDLSVGMFGMHGPYYANMAMTHADVILAVGVRFDDRVTGKLSEFGKNQQFIHIDIDPAEIGKNVDCLIPIVGSTREVLKQLVDEVKPRKLKSWQSQIDAWKKDHPLSDASLNGKVMPTPQAVIKQLYDHCKGKAAVAVDVGQHQMWAAQYFRSMEPRRFFSSSGLGTMGFGMPAALGAKFGLPDDDVLAIVGDGGFLMTCQELYTAARYDKKVIVAVINNGYLGMVRQWQQLFYGNRLSSVEIPRLYDIVKIAEGFGCKGILVEKTEQVKPAIVEAFKCKGPVVIDFRVEQEANVFPMIPAGAAIADIIESAEELTAK